MKLIVRQYLASLRERDELDAIVPDLLSQMGLTVFTKPGRGTRQDGVDVGAYGRIGDGDEKVYLFSIKSGDLTRGTWDSDSPQSLRPSLNEILDAYIPNRLPKEYKDKSIVVCLCFGGVVQEQVRTQVEGYIDRNTTDNLQFEQWNGDTLAELILDNFLREELLPNHARSHLRKSLALLDEPESSYANFRLLLNSLVRGDSDKKEDQLTVMRQINICLWILYSWARDEENVESAYLSAELSLLHSWEISKHYLEDKTKAGQAILETCHSILSLYQQISNYFLFEKIIPHAKKRHALSSAVHPSCSIDVNLKMFDILGRLAVAGCWVYWQRQRCEEDDEKQIAATTYLLNKITSAATDIIANNPTLMLPFKDDHAIDIFLACLVLITDEKQQHNFRAWLWRITDSSILSFETNGHYPCNLSGYSDLIEHAGNSDENYKQEVTSGSILYPTLSIFAALFDFDDIYDAVQKAKSDNFDHCNFQVWYPDETSEANLYLNEAGHGATLSDIAVEREKDDLLDQVFGECNHQKGFKELSAFKWGIWPLILVACRHHRMPIPVEFLYDMYDQQLKSREESIEKNDSQ